MPAARVFARASRAAGTAKLRPFSTTSSSGPACHTSIRSSRTSSPEHTMNRPALRSIRCVPRAVAALLLVGACAGASARPEARGAWVDVEGAWTDFGRNDLQKPNDATGTRFSALAFTGDTGFTGRLSAELPVRRWGEGHRLRLAYVPLRLEGEASPGAPIRFQDTTFAAGVPATLDYRFDTWRATYSVPLFGRTDPAAGWAWRAGGTLAIRDASIRLVQGAAAQRFDDVGLVPLLHLSTARALGDGWTFEAELDGAPGPGGTGLWDGAARVRRALGPGWSVAAGLRHLRGGVDNDELYNVVSATSATLSVRFAF
jgi:hypothetical protein